MVKNGNKMNIEQLEKLIKGLEERVVTLESMVIPQSPPPPVQEFEQVNFPKFPQCWEWKKEENKYE